MIEKIELIKHDKSNWGEGPWQIEGDRIEWRHKGVPCLMVRNLSGVWCGYAAITKDHPAFGKGYDDVNVNVHGGLSYASKCIGHICHIPKLGEDGDVWWLGFDCAHFRDLQPGYEAQMDSFRQFSVDMRNGLEKPGGFNHTYRDVAYVTEEVNGLADQLIKMLEA